MDKIIEQVLSPMHRIIEVTRIKKNKKNTETGESSKENSGSDEV